MHDRLVDSVATKEDLALLRNGVGSLREDVDRLRKEMKSSEEKGAARIAAEIKASEGRLEAGMQSLEDKLEARIAVAVGDMHKELLEQMDKRFHRMWMFMIGIVGVAVAALKFLP